MILLLAIGFLVLFPFVGLFLNLNPDLFIETLTSRGFLSGLQATLVSGIVGAFVSVVFGFLFARQFALLSWKGKRLQRLGLLMPYLIPNFILAIAYVVAWNPTTGLLNSLIQFPLGLYGTVGMIFLFGVAHMPVAFLILEEKIRRMDSTLRESARLSGAGGWSLFSKIELPLLGSAFVSAFTLCFGLNISAFAIPAWIGAPERVFPLTFRIYQALQLGGTEGFSKASVLSLALLTLAIPTMLMNIFSHRNGKKFVLLSGKSSRTQNGQTAKVFNVFQCFYFAYQLFAWILPLFALIASTFVKPGCLQNEGPSCFKEFSFRNYTYVLFELSETHDALWGSIIYGGLASFLIMIISSLVLLSQPRKRLQWFDTLFSLPIATPGAILALALILTLSGRFGLNFYNTPVILVCAYVLKHLNLGFQPVRTGLTNISDSLLEAAQISGASVMQTWRYILFPILKSDFLGSFFLVLIPILGELTMSIFLVGPGFKTIGTVLFDLQDYADQASASALSILLICFVLILNQVARILSNGRLGY